MEMNQLQFAQEGTIWDFNRVKFIRIGMNVNKSEDFTLEDIRHMKTRMEEQNAKIAMLAEELSKERMLVIRQSERIKQQRIVINQKDNPEPKKDPRHDSVYQRLEALEHREAFWKQDTLVMFHDRLAALERVTAALEKKVKALEEQHRETETPFFRLYFEKPRE